MSGAARLLAPAFLTFAAGAVFGYLAGQRAALPRLQNLDRDLAAYESAMIESLQLGREQAADLRVLLSYYQAERRRLYGAHRKTLEPILADLDRRFERLIHDHILDERQRGVSARLLQPLPVLSSPTSGG